MYLIGYVITNACLCLAIYEIKTDKNHKGSLWLTFACMALRLLFDIATVISDGLALPGFLQMDVFLMLDVFMLILTVYVIKRHNRIVNVLLIVLTVIYLFGEAAGYPMKTFDDMDEFVLILELLVVYCLPLFQTRGCKAD